MRCSMQRFDKRLVIRCTGTAYQDGLCWRHQSEEIRRDNPGGHTVYGAYNHYGTACDPMTHDEWVEGVDAGKLWPLCTEPDKAFHFVEPPSRLSLLITLVKEAEAKGPQELHKFIVSQDTETLGEFVMKRIGPLQRKWDIERGVLPKDAPVESEMVKTIFGSSYGKAKRSTLRTPTQLPESSSAPQLSTPLALPPAQ
jgi:hypothetical protein